MHIDPKNLNLGWPLVLATLLATLGVGLTLGIELAVLTLAGGVLVLVIFVLWNSVLNLTGESPLSLEEAVSLAAPTTEEEQKRAVLRTLKDLEYERSVGKISERDYRDLSRTYRERAKALIRAADDGMQSSREQAERLLEKRLTKAKKKSRTSAHKAKKKRSSAERDPTAPSAAASPEADDKSESDATDVELAANEPRICPECDTKNEVDAKFCKKCGVELEDDE